MKPYYEKDGITIFHGDCREILPTLDKVDLVLTDPPYGLGERLVSGTGEWAKGFQEPLEWDKAAVDDSLIAAVLSSGRDAVIWGGNYYKLPPVRGWIIWDKCQEHSSGHFEMAWTTADIPTRAFRLSRVEAYSQMGKEHPTQKPKKLMEWCLGFFPKAQTILDPFMGSGTTLVAAKQLGRKAIGIEIEERYCEIAVKRLAQQVMDFEGVSK